MSDSGPRPGPDDLVAAARTRTIALIADLERDRADLAAAGHADGAAVVGDMIDAARRVLDTLGRPPAAP